MDQDEFLRVQRRRSARLAVTPSATRNQGGSGIVTPAREFLSQMDTAPFSEGDCGRFRRALDSATEELASALPKDGRSWGLARKLLNIYLRDLLYHALLRVPTGLDRVERCLEIPLDSITAQRIKEGFPPRSLPAWSGVKNVNVELSDRFQDAASLIAIERGFERVHLDAFWWGSREE